VSEVLTVSEASYALGVAAPTIRKWADRGQLRVLRTQSGQRIFLLADIEHLRQERAAAGVVVDAKGR
jgi:excisionase family DNA binding protein